MARHRSTYRKARRDDCNVLARRWEITRGRRGPRSYYMERVTGPDFLIVREFEEAMTIVGLKREGLWIE